jgi:hypothetical protein
MRAFILFLLAIAIFTTAKAVDTIQVRVQCTAWSVEGDDTEVRGYISSGYVIVGIVGLSSCEGSIERNDSIAEARARVWGNKYGVSWSIESNSNRYGDARKNRAVMVMIVRDMTKPIIFATSNEVDKGATIIGDTTRIDSSFVGVTDTIQGDMGMAIKIQAIENIQIKIQDRAVTVSLDKAICPCMRERAYMVISKMKWEETGLDWKRMSKGRYSKAVHGRSYSDYHRWKYNEMVYKRCKYKNRTDKKPTKQINKRPKGKRVRLKPTRGLSRTYRFFPYRNC